MVRSTLPELSKAPTPVEQVDFVVGASDAVAGNRLVLGIEYSNWLFVGNKE